MNQQDFHPFWQGVFSEMKMSKQAGDIAALPSKAVELATASPESAAAVGGVGLLAGLGAVALKRKLFKGKAKAPKSVETPSAPPPAPPPQGWSGRALLGTGLVGAGAGYYLGRKKSE